MDNTEFPGHPGAAAASSGVAEAAQAAVTNPEQVVCRVTVLKRSVQQEFSDRYRNGQVKQCDVFKDGQEFTVTQPWSAPEGFCQWAWADIRTYIMANFHGGELPMVACCTDGFRPVFFRIERSDPQA